MKDNQCVNFLQWALPRLNLRWQGFRKVRRQVCRRIATRIDELELGDILEYQRYLHDNRAEWDVLNRLCRVTISRFYRDRVVFDYFASDVFPVITENFHRKNHRTIRVWSCGCASGEEPYTVAILWHYGIRHRFPDIRLEILATDIDPVLIARARTACYEMSTLHEIPSELRGHAFEETVDGYCLKDCIKRYVRFQLQDVRQESPRGKYQVVLCRNLAFTYFASQVQQEIIRQISQVMEQGGVLITGRHELPAFAGSDFEPWVEHLPIFQKTGPDRIENSYLTY